MTVKRIRALLAKRRTLLFLAGAAVLLLAITLVVTYPRDSPPRPTSVNVEDLHLAAEPWWGGPKYYAQFPVANSAGWSDPAFFPIAVFSGKPSQAGALASLGINTYVGAEHDGSLLTSITDKGIFVIAQQEWAPGEVDSNKRAVGWFISDECDMGYSGCTPGPTDNGEYGRLAIQKQYADKYRALHDGRFLFANFGNGVLDTYWAPHTMSEQMSLVDVTSVDKYAYTSPDVRSLIRDSPYWPKGKNPESSYTYGWLQARMNAYMTPKSSKPNWVVVETAKPYLTEQGSSTIKPEQIEGAVWSSIISGASGIVYFQHNNNDKCGNYSLVQCSKALRDQVKSINKSVETLAPVLNSTPYKWTFGPGLDTSLKIYQGSAYIFAMTDGGSGKRTFKLPKGIQASTAVVVGEGRSIPVANHEFEDDFAHEFSHHIYKIQL